MKIKNLKTNRITNPVGFNLDKVMLSFVTCNTLSTKQIAAEIEVALDKEFKEVIFNSGKREDIDSLGYELKIDLQPQTTYYWKVSVWGDKGDFATSEVAYFETGKMNNPWEGRWITPNIDKDIHPVIFKEFKLDKKVKRARAYVCGLGLYEMNLNTQKVGEEYLSPNCTAYDKFLQYQTYDISNQLEYGLNKIEVILGNGWYKGRFGFHGGESEIFGDKFALLCDIVVEFEDGSTTIIKSDETWKCKESKIKFSGIYDGEVYDASFETNEEYKVSIIDLPYNKIRERLSLPVVVKEEVKPVEIITTPLGETVLDMGQNMVGWLQFKTNAPKGQEIRLKFGELLQEGNFYRGNLGTAKQEFKYIANGKETIVRPHFTYYGFRYVKVEGWIGEVKAEDFVGQVLYSDMETTGHIETSNYLVNRLFLNAMWGQKGNFLDVPTDCPQRDERMGWTGDAQVFCQTASFNMDTYAFFTKYTNDIYQEQICRNGEVPTVVPVISAEDGTSSAWGDAATIIPWNIYVHYGDKTILEKQFDSMKAWVDYIRKEDENSGGNRLWDSGFHFGDWLAQDGEDANAPTGGTEELFIASAYYYYSAKILSKSAKVLGKDDIYKEYRTLADEIKEAIQDEFLTKNGRLALKNQTAYIVALYMNLIPDKDRKRVAKDLITRLEKDRGYLKTGFVGTPYFCKALSQNGYNEYAYNLLLNKNFPSWLYPVTMGATTIWERWNSVLPDGRVNPTDMNSLNHYAYGSVVEWMYRYMAGLNPVEDVPGFRYINLTPMPDYRFKYVNSSYNSPVGLYESSWSIKENGELNFKFNIPFNATANLVLPDAKLEEVYVNGRLLKDTELIAIVKDENVVIELVSGVYEFKYNPTKSYIRFYNTSMSLDELLSHEEVGKLVKDNSPAVVDLMGGMGKSLSYKSMRELNHMPFFHTSEEEMDLIDEIIGNIKIEA